jgi:hypothetical protein
VFGSVASVMSSTRAAMPRPSRSANPGSKTTASCAAPRWNRLSRSAVRGKVATIWNASVAANRLRSASVAASGAASTTASRTRWTSVRMAKPKRMTCSAGRRVITASVRRSRRMW